MSNHDPDFGIPPISKNTRNPRQVQTQQQADAEKTRQRQPAAVTKPGAVVKPAVTKPVGVTVPPAMVPAVATPPAIPAVSGREYRDRYLDEVAPASFPGQLLKFSKDGVFVIAESGDEIDPGHDFVALCDETLVGWIKFSAVEGEPPARVQGLLYDGFAMPEREGLGDLDPAKWPLGLSGAAEDPWQHQIVLVLQDRETLDLYSFATSSKTGRRAVGNLLRHFDRLARSHPDTYPVVRLKPSGFTHRDPRIGWVHVPSFAVVGRAPKTSAEKPDTSVGSDMDDRVPF